eukprot:14277889-Heterocapsa_arctica.AAC.1
MKWLRDVIQALPTRCQPILLMDANAHVGSQDQESLPVNLSEAVGPCMPEVQNWTGSQLEQTMNAVGLVLVNTYRPEGAGATWHSGHGRATRIDYIALPAQLLQQVKQCRVWLSTGLFLQLSMTPNLVDHSPLVVDFLYRDHHCSQQSWRHRHGLDLQAAQCIRISAHLSADFVEQVEDWLNNGSTNTHWDDLTVDEVWEFINGGLREVAESSTATADHLEYHWQNEDTIDEWNTCMLVRHEMICYSRNVRTRSRLDDHIWFAYLLHEWYRTSPIGIC